MECAKCDRVLIRCQVFVATADGVKNGYYVIRNSICICICTNFRYAFPPSGSSNAFLTIENDKCTIYTEYIERFEHLMVLILLANCFICTLIDVSNYFIYHTFLFTVVFGTYSSYKKRISCKYIELK